MPMTTDEAMEYLKKMHEDSDPQPEKPATTEGTGESTEGAPAKPEEIQTPAPESKPEEARETSTVEEPEKKVHNEPNRKLSRQERIDHAFQRMKQRNKAELEAKDKRIAELEERMKKYSVLEQADFNPDDLKAYIDHKFALQTEQSELDSLKRDRAQIERDTRMQEATHRHEEQVNDCFATQEEKERYWTLLRNGGGKFREFLDDYDDGTIDEFVGDSDIAPILISTLMRNPDVLRSIIEKPTKRRKEQALYQLENRLLVQRKIGAVRENPETHKNPAPKLPIVGSQVSNPGSSSESGKRDWNRYLAEHPRGA